VSRAEAKKARRNKRRAKRDANWIADTVLDDIVEDADTADYLEHFHQFVTQRGWTYEDENSDDTNVAWYYEPSIDGGEGKFTTIWISAEDDGEFVYVLLTGTSEGYRFEPEEFVERIEEIEAYRSGDSTTP
jgi:hypothetical protein